MIQELKTREDYKKIAYYLLFFTLVTLIYTTYVFYLNFYYHDNYFNKLVQKIHFPYSVRKLLFLKVLPLFFMTSTYMMWFSAKPISLEDKKKYKNYAFASFFAYIILTAFEVYYLNNLFTAAVSIILFSCIFYYLLESQKTIVIDLKKDRRNVTESQFDQKRDFVLTDVSVNIEYLYSYLSNTYTSFANVVNPFRGSLVGGTPGSGKTFAIIEEYFRQFMMKGFAGAFYDYKYPTLTVKIYNYLNWYYNNEFIAGYNTDDKGVKTPIIKKSYPIKPKFYVINLDDPAYSNRCNPISQDSLETLADADDATKNLLLNINRTWIEKEGDFFTDSANVYTSMLMWYLKLMSKKYDYDICSLPHLIALSTFPSTEVMFLILNNYNDLKPKMTPFLEALEKGALEQLAGQVASAGIALSKISSPELFYILTGSDFDFNINDPLNPKVIAVGNNPQRDDTYAAPLGLILAKIIKAINVQEFYNIDNVSIKRSNVPSFLIIDEFPTIYLRSIDKLIGTARSNKVAVVLGFQSFAQVIAGYTKEIADKIIRVCGNRFAGQLMDEDAKIMSETIGKQKILSRSYNYSHQDVTEGHQIQMEEIVPAARISQLSQGEFTGLIADDFDYQEENKIMFGAVKPPMHLKKHEEVLTLPLIRDFAPKDLENLIIEFNHDNATIIKDITQFLSNTPLTSLTSLADKNQVTIIYSILESFGSVETALLKELEKLSTELQTLQNHSGELNFDNQHRIDNLRKLKDEKELLLSKTNLGITFSNYDAFKNFYSILDLKILINKVLFINKSLINSTNTLNEDQVTKFINEGIRIGLITSNKNKIIKEYENDIYNDIYRIVALEILDLNIIDVFLKKNPKGVTTLKAIFESIVNNENFNDDVIKSDYNKFINILAEIENL